MAMMKEHLMDLIYRGIEEIAKEFGRTVEEVDYKYWELAENKNYNDYNDVLTATRVYFNLANQIGW